ncbi:MAG: polyketide cyclase [Sphingobacteriaceae bacterium]|nr:MAG: polyketide cyclase [Sphingobacteriaceae bacterium]
MKILKTILIAVAVIIAVVLITALFVKKDYAVEREVIINKPKEQVYDYVKYLKNQNNFSKWAQMDPVMHKEFRGTDGTVGFVSAWSSDSSDVGKGEQEIKKIVPGERIDYEIRFIEPFASVAPAHITFEAPSAGETKVKWGFEGHMPYPMNIMQLFMNMEEMIGGDLQIGLNNLKNILEKQ